MVRWLFSSLCNAPRRHSFQSRKRLNLFSNLSKTSFQNSWPSYRSPKIVFNSPTSSPVLGCTCPEPFMIHPRLLLSILLLVALAFLPVLAAADKPLKIVCVGAHPDDPESGCAGTLARYSALGHSVAVIYLTRGERGIRGKALDEAAAIRTEEAREACKVMGARAVFAGQIDGATEVNKARVDE